MSRSLSRRSFAIGATAATLSPNFVGAQPVTTKVPRIGVLWHAGSRDEEKLPLGWLEEGFTDIGYRLGENIILEHRFPAEILERFQTLANELVESRVDILVPVTLRAATAAKRATTSIPIVFVVVPDPIGSKIVDNLARPRGNITGLASMAVEVTPKRVQLLKDSVPDLTRLALLVNATDRPGTARYIEAGRTVADPLGVSITPIEVTGPDDFERAFATISEQRLQGIVVTQDGLFNGSRASNERIAQLAIQHRLPMIGYAKAQVDAGTFMSYGPSNESIFRRTGVLVDKILKGKPAGEIPVEQPSKFELCINEKTAKSLGLTVSSTLLELADSLIQ